MDDKTMEYFVLFTHSSCKNVCANILYFRDRFGALDLYDITKNSYPLHTHWA